MSRTFASGTVLLLASLLTGSPRQISPQIHVDKDGYLAGEPIQLSGIGFPPSDRVSLRVTHRDGTAEPSAGHEEFFAVTNASGAFQATWSIDLHDRAGLEFVVSAEAAGGATDQTAFARVGSISAERGGSVPHVIAEGFNASEVVAISLSDSHAHAPQIVLSDDDGRVVADIDLPASHANAASIILTASAEVSGLVLRVSLSDYSITSRKPNGVPLLEEARSSIGLAEIGQVRRNGSEDILMTWSTDSWRTPGQTAQACALFDTNDDRAADLAVCGEVQSRSADASAVVQAASSPRLFACDNVDTDRCGHPASLGTAAQVRAYVKSGTLNDLARDENLRNRDASSATLRIVVGEPLLPHGAALMRVCSYRGNAGSLPIDCIVPSGDNALPSSSDVTVATTALGPALAGRIVYHSYVSYNDGTSQLFELNLATGTLKNLSSGWKSLKDPMNAHWSPDGTRIVFMARPKKGGSYSAWYDIFLYTFGQSGEPINLTKTASRHDEDPKFSPDGSRIVYRVRPSTLVEMDLGGVIRNTIISTSGQERSMPFYTADAKAVWFTNRPTGGSASATSIRRINVNGTNESVPADTAGVTDFYPIRDTVAEFLYARTISSNRPVSTVWLH